jgi:uncharacterized protein YoxC
MATQPLHPMPRPTPPFDVTLTILRLCRNVLDIIATYARDVKRVDHRIDQLQVEVDALKSAVAPIHQKANDNRTDRQRLSNTIANLSGGGPVNQDEYWKNLQHVLTECNTAMTQLEGLLRMVNHGGIPLLRKVNLNRRLSNKIHEIDGLRNKIATYRKSVQLSLEFINL